MLQLTIAYVRSMFPSKPARQGRARIFAEKTVGSDDPGMIVVQRIVEELARP